MSKFRSLNRTILGEIQVSAGTDPSPTISANAILLEGPNLAPELGSQQTNESSGSLDRRGSIPTGGSSSFTGRAYIHGSGTPETPPDWGALARACGLAESILSSAYTGTAQAGGASSITFASALSVADNALRGRVVRTTGGTGSGQTRILTGNVGSTDVGSVSPPWAVQPDATTTYSIDKSVIYRPTSTLELLTIYEYLHASDGGNSKLTKAVDCAGNMRLRLAPSEVGTLDFTFQGSLLDDSDVSHPGAATLQSTRPFPWLNAPTYLGSVAVKAATLELDMGNGVQLVENPNQTFGYDGAGITGRRITGSLLVPAENKATRDNFAAWQNSTQYAFTTIWGTTAGARFALLIPTLKFSTYRKVERNGFVYDELPFEALGEDSAFYLTQW